jgi:hypothetical protein
VEPGQGTWLSKEDISSISYPISHLCITLSNELVFHPEQTKAKRKAEKRNMLLAVSS